MGRKMTFIVGCGLVAIGTIVGGVIVYALLAYGMMRVLMKGLGW